MKRELDEIYTLENTRDNSWATWLTTSTGDGRYELSLLCARENSERESYKAVARAAFLSNGSCVLVIFNPPPSRVVAVNFLANVLIASGVWVKGYEMGAGSLPPEFVLLPPTRCKVCGRLCTRPFSIRTRMGDECAGRKPRAGSKFQAAKSLASPEEMRAQIAAREQERRAAKVDARARLLTVKGLTGVPKTERETGRIIL